jgi:methylmalonyl-CoA mutase
MKRWHRPSSITHQLSTINSAFDVLFVETVGVGQEAMPFAPGAVDRTVLVMSPDYGAALQLQKIAMLDLADVVVVNKSDLARARTAGNEVERRIASNARGQRVVSTTAKRHADPGVDGLFHLLIADAPPAEARR